jgi:hypothetical protein
MFLATSTPSTCSRALILYRSGGGARVTRQPALRRHFGAKVPRDPARQAAYLKDLNRASPEMVVEMYESGKVAASKGNLGEYLKVRPRGWEGWRRGAEFRV